MTKAAAYALAISVAMLLCCTHKRKDLSDHQKEVIGYFKDVALGFEFGDASHVSRKWEKDMKIFVGGTPSAEIMNELDRIITEVNLLTANDDFKILTTSDTTQSNCYLFFGAGNDFSKVIPSATAEIESNLGVFYVWYDDDDIIYRAVVYVDIYRATAANIQKHLLREELTQSLGLARDSKKYPESIFQQDWTDVTEYAPIDRDLIRLLYDPDMETGMDENSIEPVLEELVVGLEPV